MRPRTRPPISRTSARSPAITTKAGVLRSGRLASQRPELELRRDRRLRVRLTPGGLAARGLGGAPRGLHPRLLAPSPAGAPARSRARTRGPTPYGGSSDDDGRLPGGQDSPFARIMLATVYRGKDKLMNLFVACLASTDATEG
jgi:hypothetical protein